MTQLVHAVMCGGSGTRLWPWSRRDHPKQFLALAGGRTLLAATVERLAGEAATLIVANAEHRFLVAEQLGAVGVTAEVLLEPAMRNTAPVALVAALHAQRRFGPDCIVALAPADHLIADSGAYRSAISRAAQGAGAGRIVTLGIRPDRPATGFGYIEAGDAVDGLDGIAAVARFLEKPDHDTAENLLASGRYLWNAGIFVFAPATLIELARDLQPAMLDACIRALDGAGTDLGQTVLDKAAYSGIEAISFDYAFAEHMGEAGAVVPVSFDWSDAGSWASLHDALAPGDPQSNVTAGDVEVVDSAGVLAFSDGPLVVAHGLRDMVVVANKDAVYVAPASRSQDVRTVVAEMERRGRPEATSHRRVHRPWGWYETIALGDRFHVKQIVVQPGGRLSLQSHHHRSEHWVVVRGTAAVTIDNDQKLVMENESVFIRAFSRHRLENPGKIPVHLIEVQTGSYLGEDDIIRYDDVYGRS